MNSHIYFVIHFNLSVVPINSFSYSLLILLINNQYNLFANKSMSSQLNLDIEVAAAKDLIAKPVLNRPIEKPKVDVAQLNRQAAQRMQAALQTREENILRDNEVREQAIQQKRLQKKEIIFAKYRSIIETELQAVKIEFQNQNALYLTDHSFVNIRRYAQPTDLQMLQVFQQNLAAIRESTCSYKYCGPSNQDYCALHWVFCWCAIPFYCCYRGCCAEDRNQTRLRQLYEKYERMMEEELGNTMFEPRQNEE